MGQNSIRPAAPARALFTTLLAVLFVSAWSSLGRGDDSLPDARYCIVDHVAIASWGPTAALAGAAPCSPTATPGFDAYIRDVNGVPLPGRDVALKFGASGSSVAVYANQFAGVTVNCADHSLHQVSNAAGNVHFVPRFGRYEETPVIQVTAFVIPIKTIEARSPDYDGDGLVGLSDFALFSTDYLDPGGGRPRSDFNDCPGVTLADFAFFSGQYLASQAQAAEAICP
jgi:hypothetical protein